MSLELVTAGSQGQGQRSEPLDGQWGYELVPYSCGEA